MDKLHKTLKTKTNSNKLLLWMFFAFVSKLFEHFKNTLKIAGNSVIWLSTFFLKIC